MSLHQTNTDHDLSEELFIFERMADGDHHALRFFFDKYYEELCNFVNLYLRNKTISEDIVQDIFIYFWEKRGVIRIDSSVRSYLIRASRNKYLNYLRDEKSHQAIQVVVASKSETIVSPNYTLLDAGQLEDIINGSIENLPPRCREIYLFHKHDNLSYKEIALRMDISEKTVENQMSIALKKLRLQLAPYYEQIFVFLLFSLIEK